MKKTFFKFFLAFLGLYLILNLYTHNFFNNKFTTTLYGKEITLDVPLFSYYNNSSGMTVYRFKTLLPNKIIRNKVNNYLLTLKKLDCNDDAYYSPEYDITIFSYTYDNKKILKNIYIGVDIGNVCEE